jgi:hypothetical protein
MRYRVVFFAGLGIGFVIGTRAGRERYEQLRRLARKVADNPSVQQAAGVLQAQAAGYAKTAGGKVADRAGAARQGVQRPTVRRREWPVRSGAGGNGHPARRLTTAAPDARIGPGGCPAAASRACGDSAG